MLDQKEIVSEVKVIVFRLKDEEYGVEVNQVKSIEKLEHITRVPRTPKFVKGVINLRGVVTPIIDLRNRFGLEDSGYSEASRIIIVAVGELEVGLIVDAANDVIDIESSLVADPPEIVGGIKAKYIRGIATLEDRRLLVMLNLPEVLSKYELMQLENLEE